MIAFIPDSALITVNTLEILGIVYLAVGYSRLAQRISRLEGRAERNGERKQP